MELTFAHYRNRFCMFRTYYGLAVGKVKPDGFNMKALKRMRNEASFSPSSDDRN